LNVLTIDIGGTSVKMLATGHTERRKFPSGPELTPSGMVVRVKQLTLDWQYEAVSIGYPGRVQRGVPVSEPNNLGPGWVGFDFASAFGCPVKILNDAAMQALGSYRGGTMLFLGLGTGLGSALVAEGTVVPLELGHLSVGRKTFEDELGVRGLWRLGRKRWTKRVAKLTRRFVSALELDDVVLGGGNAKKLKSLPDACRLGSNADAFTGGFRLWQGTGDLVVPPVRGEPLRRLVPARRFRLAVRARAARLLQRARW
jgi:predicted NBD/HSP70 family sugar kinase